MYFLDFFSIQRCANCFHIFTTKIQDFQTCHCANLSRNLQFETATALKNLSDSFYPTIPDSAIDFKRPCPFIPVAFGRHPQAGLTL